MKLVELHCHTTYSNSKTTECLTTPRQLLAQAKKKGLSAIAITDHDTMDGYKKAKKLANKYGITLIPAMEIDSNLKGQILAYGLKKTVKAGRPVEKIIKDVQAQGGVAIVPHPFDAIRRMENLNAVAKLADGLEILNFGAVFNKKTIRFAKENGIRVQTGGSDAHHRSLIGTVVVGFPDSCTTWHDYIKCLKKGDFVVTVNRNYYQAISIGILNIFYTRSVGFLWNVFPQKRLALEIDGVFYLVKFVIKAPFNVSFTVTRSIYHLSGLAKAVSKITS